MSAPSTRKSTLELTVLSGPDQGLRLPLKDATVIPIGRSTKGLMLTDPLASLRHAEIRWTERGYYLVDLGSATGTRLGDREVGEQPVALMVGDVILIGESRIRVERWDHRMLRRSIIAGLSMAILWMLWQGISGGALVSSGDALTWHVPIRQGLTANVRLDPEPIFARQHGIDPTLTSIRRVTDFDRNGIDEVWLVGGQTEQVLTFSDDGSWEHLGSFPAGCADDEAHELSGGRFPALRCPGTRYELIDGTYRLVLQQGVVVWARPEQAAEAPAEGEPRAAEPGVEVSRIPLVRPERLAGFLAARGITEPVAWILCEGALPEVRSQVRTARGEIRPLSFGCHRDLQTQGQSLGRVLAVATTGGGREALLEDLTRFYAGAADGLFLEEGARKKLAPWRADPGYLRGGTRLDAEGSEQLFQPVPPEGPVPGRGTPLPASGHTAAPAALTATLLTAGTARLDPPGCVQLEVTNHGFTCEIGGACRAASTFMEIDEVGCGERQRVLTVPYSGGTIDGEVGGLQVRAVVESTPTASRVLRAQVSYRKEKGAGP